MRGTGELVLYVDYDGVLHHENVLWHPKIGAYLSAPDGYVLFQHAELLERMLAPYPEVQIVLSTSWVRRYGCSKSAKQLRTSLRTRVIGATFHSNMNEQEFSQAPRGMQVWRDVVKRKPRAWLALDDDWLDWPKWCLDNYVKRRPAKASAPRQCRTNSQRNSGRCASERLEGFCSFSSLAGQLTPAFPYFRAALKERSAPQGHSQFRW